jgi:hypothetical protein
MWNGLTSNPLVEVSAPVWLAAMRRRGGSVRRNSSETVRPIESGHAWWTGIELKKGVKKLPDIWTEEPEIVLALLRGAGFTCGVEPRVLPGRDPEWTCIIDGRDIAGDLYIHHVDTAPGQGTPAWVLVVLGILLIVVLCQAWAIVKLRRRTGGSGAQPDFDG